MRRVPHCLRLPELDPMMTWLEPRHDRRGRRLATPGACPPRGWAFSRRLAIENLEDRRLLALSTNSFDAVTGALVVVSNAADNVTISSSGGNVLVNGANPSSPGGPISASLVTSISVSGNGTFNNTIDLQGVTNTTFAALQSLLINGGAGADSIVLGSVIATTGSQLYLSPVVLQASVTLNAGVGSVTFGSTIDAATAGAPGLAINTSGTTTFNGRVGALAALASLATDAGGSTTLNAGQVTTSGSAGIAFSDPVTLAANTTASAGTGGITFGAVVDGAFSLATNSTGLTKFAGALGAVTPLTAVSTNAGGSTLLSGGSIFTTSAAGIAFGDAVSLVANTNLSAVAGPITFGGAVDGGFGLTTSTTGQTTFTGAVGATATLVSVSTGSGSTLVSGGVINTNGAAGQSFSGAVTLGANALFSTAAGPVAFGGTLNAATAGAQGATINSTGLTSIAGAVGGVAALSFLTTNSGGSTQLNGGAATTTTFQTFSDALSLGANTTLAGTTLSILGGINSGAASLTINGNGAFAGLVSVASLRVTGSSTLGGSSLTTTAAAGQTFSGAVTLATNVALSASTGPVMFGSTINGTFSLQVNSTGTTTFGGSIGATTALAALATDSGGNTLLNTGMVTTNGPGGIVFGDALTLGANLALAASAGPISLSATVDGAFTLQALTSGQTTFAAAVGLATPLKGLVTDSGGSTRIGGRITATGSLTFDDAVVLLADVVLTVGANNVAFGDTIDGAFSLTTSAAGTVTLAGAVGGTAPLAGLTVNGSPTSVAINGATVATTGTQSYSAASVLLGANTTLTASAAVFTGTTPISGGLRTLTVNGSATFGGSVAAASVSVSGAATLFSGVGGSVTTTAVAGQSYLGRVVLGGQSITLDAGSGRVSFGAAVDGAAALTVLTTGICTLSGPVGSTTRLTSLTTSTGGSTVIAGGVVSTTALQSYNDPVTLNANASLTATSVLFAATLSGAASTLLVTGNAEFDDTVSVASVSVSGTTVINGRRVTTTAVAGQHFGGAVTLLANIVFDAGSGGLVFDSTLNGAVTVSAIAAGTTFGGAVGGTTPLLSLSTNAGGSTLIQGGAITTTAAAGQVFGDAIRLGAATLFSATTGAITFSGTIDGAFALTANTAGITTFSGAVGNATPVASLTTDLTGQTVLRAGIKTLSGGIVFNDPVSLRADATLTATAGPITLGSTIDGAFDLTVDTSGATTFAAVVGGTTPLASLTTDAAGSTAIHGGTVTTTGAAGQSYGDAVTLGANTTIVAYAAPVTFGGTLDAAVAGMQSLTVRTTGVTTFAGAVGGVAAPSFLSTNNGGSTQISGGAVTTTGSQTFTDPLTLSSNTTLSGTTISVASTVTGAGATLTINGHATLGGRVNLGSLIVTGTAALGGGLVTTTASGGQTFTGAVTLNANTTLTAGGGSVVFGSTINGTFSLAINSSGITTFGGAIGGTVPLVSLATDVPGTTQFNAASATTTGFAGIVFADLVTLGADATLNAGAAPINFQASVDGGFSLQVNTSGATTFSGAVGASTPLKSLTTDRGGSTRIDGGLVSTLAATGGSGDQTFGDNVTLGNGAVLRVRRVVFQGTVDGAAAQAEGLNILDTLAATGGGDASFQDDVGGTRALAFLAVAGNAELGALGGGIRVVTAGSGAGPQGNQSYSGFTRLVNAAIFSGRDVYFGKSLDGRSQDSSGQQGLNILNTGVVTFNSVGATTPLDYFYVKGRTNLNGAVTTLRLASGAHLGSQSYSQAVAVGANAVLTGTDIYFGATTDGAANLDINSAGTVTFAASIGATAALNQLRVVAGQSYSQSVNVSVVAGYQVTAPGISIVGSISATQVTLSGRGGVNDSLIVSGTAASELVAVDPQSISFASSPGMPEVGRPAIAFARMATLQINTLGGDDNVSFQMQTPLPFGSLRAVRLDGGTGSDTFRVLGTGGSDIVQLGVIDDLASPLSPLQIRNVEALQVFAFAGNDTIVNRTSVPALLSGGDGDDALVGGAAGDVIFGGDGLDQIFGNYLVYDAPSAAAADAAFAATDSDYLLPDREFVAAVGGQLSSLERVVVGENVYAGVGSDTVFAAGDGLFKSASGSLRYFGNSNSFNPSATRLGQALASDASAAAAMAGLAFVVGARPVEFR